MAQTRRGTALSGGKGKAPKLSSEEREALNRKERNLPLDEALRLLSDMLQNETNAHVIWSIADALRFVDNPQAIEPLGRLADSEIPNVRAKAAEGLGNIADSDGDLANRALSTLVRLSEDPERDVRSWATFALG